MGARKFLNSELQTLFDGGYNIADAARKLAVTYQAVRTRMLKHGIRYAPPACPPFPDIAQLVQEGWKTGDIARKYDADYRRVWWWIRHLKIPYDPAKKGHYNGQWKGGRCKAGPYIYIWCPEHPRSTKHGYVFEHRLVMELKLGRYLLPEEVVHHKKGYKNNLGNLELFESNAAHLAATLKGRIPKWTPEGRRRILAAIRLPRGPRKKSNRVK